MNRLDTQTQARVISCLIEGCSIRATVRMTGAAKNTVVKLLADIGCACAGYHNRTVRNLKVRRLQADEIWSFVERRRRIVSAEKKQEGWGDVWTWVGIDADTKLVVSYLVGGRDGGWAMISWKIARNESEPGSDHHRRPQGLSGCRRERLRRGYRLRACCRKFTAHRSTKRRGATLRPVHRLRYEGREWGP